MPKESSVAPKERVNIVYKPAIGDETEEKELPLKLLMIGDYTLRPDSTPLEERKPISVDKDTFNNVMAKQELKLSVVVPSKLSGQAGDELTVNLEFPNEKSFSPESIVRQVPQLNQLLQIREALKALRGPLGNKRAFREKIENLVKDQNLRERLLSELGIAK